MASSVSHKRTKCGVSDDPVKFCNEKHAKTILSELNKSRRNENLCDGSVVIGQHEIKVQKAVLSAACHYFRLLFGYNGVNGEPQSVVDITSLNIHHDTFETILDYIYTAEIDLSEDNIQDILQASDVLLLCELKAICCDYLESCITLQNCLGIMEFASRFNCPWIHLKVSQYIDEHFRELTYTEEFSRLSDSGLISLLSRNTLNVPTEDDILDSIVQWYEADIERQATSVASVVRNCIRRRHVSQCYISRLESSSFGEKWPEVIQYLREVDRGDQGKRGLTEVIFIAGGVGENENEVGVDTFEVKGQVRCMNPRIQVYERGENLKSKWFDLPSLTIARTGHELVQCGGCVYVIGGKNGNNEILRSGEKYDPTTNCWTPITSMSHYRLHFGLVAIDDNIYAVGGCTKSDDPSSSMEVYNIFTNKWRCLPDMNIKRKMFSCVALNKKIYVIGGGSHNKLHEAVECFDAVTETWHSVSPLLEKRYGSLAVATKNEIFVFGGKRRIDCPHAAAMSHNSMKVCGNEYYVEENDTWNKFQEGSGPLAMSCHPQFSQFYAAVTNQEDIYVLGRLDMAGDGVHCVRCYDQRSNTWMCTAKNSPPHQEHYAACMVKIPTCVMDKIISENLKKYF